MTQPDPRMWQVSPWVESTVKESLLAFTMPPALIDRDTTPSTWANEVSDSLLRRFEPGSLAPNYMGVRVHDGGLAFWTDHLGLGRVYVYESDEVIAASNNIGALVPLMKNAPTLDDDAIARFASLGWFSENSTPFREVRRLAAGTAVHVAPGGRSSNEAWFDPGPIYTPDSPADYESVVTEMNQVSLNLSAMATATPRVALSGGKDSRMTTAMWLASRADAEVFTFGDLPEEANVARELMGIFFESHGDADQQVTHEVSFRSKAGQSDLDPLEKRINNAFKLWNGDAAPIKLRSNVRPLNAKRFQVSGIGGEITHGYFYGKPGQLETIRAAGEPLDRLRTAFARKPYLTPFALNSVNSLIDRCNSAYTTIGLDDFRRLDYFYVNEKLRRWSPQGMNTASPAPLCVPAFQKLAFSLSEQEQVNIEAPMKLANTAIPGWGNVRTYKASPKEAAAVAVRTARTWNTDPEHFATFFSNEEHAWQDYILPTTIHEALARIERHEMSEMYESFLLRSIWIDSLQDHIQELSAKHRAWRRHC
ncbi:hypothetical protein ACFU1Q_13030 [Brachybacterium paraconglomeratum]